MKGVMVDLETMGTGPSAAIIAIGAVEFDTDTGVISDDRFYAIVDLASAVADGGIMDPSTVLWWMKQSDAARGEFRREGRSIQSALHGFVQYMAACDASEVWGNGATFDNVILRSAYNRAGIHAPWSYRDDRCFRTIAALHPEVSTPSVGTAHNAVDDAEYQARHLINIFKGEKV